MLGVKLLSKSGWGAEGECFPVLEIARTVIALAVLTPLEHAHLHTKDRGGVGGSVGPLRGGGGGGVKVSNIDAE